MMIMDYLAAARQAVADREAWLRIAQRPSVRFPFLLDREMEHLCWYAIFFGCTEHAQVTARHPSPPSPDLDILFGEIALFLFQDRYFPDDNLMGCD